MESTRTLLVRVGFVWKQAAFLWISALLPYLIFSLGAGTFQRQSFLLLCGLTLVLLAWNLIFPRRWAYDFGFLVIAAAPIVLRVFRTIYHSPDPHIRLEILGQLMWIRIGLVSLLLFREWNPGPVGLWPTLKEWRSGVMWFAVVALPLFGVGLATHDVSWSPLPLPAWKIAAIGLGTFFGILWVVAFSEELFFRGVVERALLNSAAGPLLAIAVSTTLYGASHLWFHQFPDWRQSTVAGILGIACGISYWRTGSIRSSMVTHAMAVTTWRVLFSK
jgi:membrane protease YdiL (CAAX protease family)